MGLRAILTKKEESPSSPHHGNEGDRLWRWVFFSGLLHVLIIWSLLFIPYASSRGAISYPVYTVELVSGEKIGGASGAGIKPAPKASKKKPKKKPKRVKKKAPPPVPAAKVVKKVKPKRQVAVLKKPKKAKKKKAKKQKTPRTPDKVTLKRSKKKVKKEEPTETDLPEPVRNRLIQAALDRIKQRAETRQKEKSEAMEAELGPGEGQGAAASKPDGRGGGIIKGVEFLIYRNRMLYQIKERWTWVGKRTDLEVTVRFGIRENGEIVGLRVVDGSGDLSYDDSVIRAVRRASPLPPPPDSYLKDFMDVELTFRPGDLSG